MLLALDGSLNDQRVVGVGDQADDQVMLAHSSLQRSRILHIQGRGFAARTAAHQIAGGGQRAAGWCYYRFSEGEKPGETDKKGLVCWDDYSIPENERVDL